MKVRTKTRKRMERLVAVADLVRKKKPLKYPLIADIRFSKN
jgi:hypothetical protein